MAKAARKAIPPNDKIEVEHTADSPNAYVIDAAKSRWGPNSAKWGKDEYAQAVIADFFPVTLPKTVSYSRLKKRVNKVLADNREFQDAFKEGDKPADVSRQTVKRAFEVLLLRNS